MVSDAKNLHPYNTECYTGTYSVHAAVAAVAAVVFVFGFPLIVAYSLWQGGGQPATRQPATGGSDWSTLHV